MWLNIRDFKILDGLAAHTIAKYARPYDILHKPHLDVYTLKFLANFVAHPTFHISKLKLFMCDEQRLYQKQKLRSEVDAITHSLTAKIKAYFMQGRHAS